MPNIATLSNKGLISAGTTSGTAIVRASTYNKKYHAFCTVIINNEDDVATPSDWSTNTKKILLHSPNNKLQHVLNIPAQFIIGGGYGIGIDSSNNWKVESNSTWITDVTPLQGNGPTDDYPISFQANDNTSTTNRRAILTGTNLVSNDTSIFIVIQEGKLEESVRKLFIYHGNDDYTNSTYQNGLLSSVKIKIVPKVYQNNTWIDSNFEWGCNILTNNNYINSTSPSLNGSLTQFNTEKEITFYFKEPRPSTVDFNIQVKSNSTSPNQAISDIIVSSDYTAPEPTLDGNMKIRIFKNNTEIEIGGPSPHSYGTISNLNKDGEIFNLVIKTYKGSGNEWVVSNTTNECYGASIDHNYIGLSSNPELTGSYTQFYGEQTLTITVPQNTDTSTKDSEIHIFSNTDGNTYFGGMIILTLSQNAQTEPIISTGELTEISTERVFYYDSQPTLEFKVTSNSAWKLFAKNNDSVSTATDIIYNTISSTQSVGSCTGNATSNFPTTVNVTLPINSGTEFKNYKFYLYGYNRNTEETTNLIDSSDTYTIIPQNLNPSNWDGYISATHRNNYEEANTVPFIECSFDIVVKTYFPHTIYIGNTPFADIYRMDPDTGLYGLNINGSAGETIYRFIIQQNSNISTRDIKINIRSTSSHVNFDDTILVVTQEGYQESISNYAFIKQRFIKLYPSQRSTTIDLYTDISGKYRTTFCTIGDESNNNFYIGQEGIEVTLSNSNTATIELYNDGLGTRYDEISIMPLPTPTVDYQIY